MDTTLTRVHISSLGAGFYSSSDYSGKSVLKLISSKTKSVLNRLNSSLYTARVFGLGSAHVVLIPKLSTSHLRAILLKPVQVKTPPGRASLNGIDVTPHVMNRLATLN
jgi:hypothetical protein